MRQIPTGKRIELTPRDLEIFKLLVRYRYLRSTYIHAFVGGDRTKLIERLGHLYHEGGYLDRPRQQWEAINARYMPLVYELGEGGERVLQEHGIAVKTRSGDGKSRRFWHELMVCDIVASIELETRAEVGLRFIPWEEILASPRMPAATRDSPNPRAIAAPASYPNPRTKTPTQVDGLLVPDALFGIEYARDGQKSYRFFAVEADRNTEPATRADPNTSSYLRKIAQYQEIAARALYRGRWGLPNLLVLNVTTSERRMDNLLGLILAGGGQAASSLLFSALPLLASYEAAPQVIPDLLKREWRRAGLSPLKL